MRILYFLIFLVPVMLQAQPIKPGTDELYQSRLASLRSPIELIYRPEVKKYIDAYLDNPEHTRQILMLSKTTFPLIERALRYKGVSTDLKYLAVALSELDNKSQNPYGAVGMWMMMYNVGKMYKAKMNSFVDERLDPYKSSVIAATHFKDLYSIYHQWPLVIAAYASSPVTLNKGIRMSGNSLYFWDVYPNLPENTRDIYPRFIAAAYIINFYREHGIRSVVGEAPVAIDSVLVNKWLSLQQIAATLEIPIDQLRKQNPVFRKDIIPYNLDGYWIYLPAGKAEVFDRLKDTVYNPLPRPIDFAPVQIAKEPNDTTQIASPEKAPETKPDKGFHKKRLTYKVKRGDVIDEIADWYDVTSSEIKSWNKLRTSKIKKGQTLVIWVNEKKTGYYKRINGLNERQKRKIAAKD